MSTDTTSIPSTGSRMSRKNAPTASGVAAGVVVGSGADVGGTGVAVAGTAVGCAGEVTLDDTGRGIGFAFRACRLAQQFQRRSHPDHVTQA